MRYYTLGFLSITTILLLITFVAPVAAQPKLACGAVDQPAATVFLPYFEVDLEQIDGPNTLFAVGNRGEEATLAHAVVWTNWGHPVLSFDFFLNPGALQSFNLRLLLQGEIPETSPPATLPEDRFASCSSPAELPSVDPTRLRALLTGQPDPDAPGGPDGGLCYSAAVDGDRLATGYITVDAVHDCSGTALVTPNDQDYFGDCASGLATNDNVLWGDFFLIDASENFAQGERLVSIIADQIRFGDNGICVDPPCGFRNERSFYVPTSNRMPLARSYEARFLNGGGFDGGTDLLVWSEGSLGPVNCSAGLPAEGTFKITTDFRDEAGNAVGSLELVDPAKTFRVRVGSPEMPMDTNFGCVELNAKDATHGSPQQLWSMTLLSAQGRFSIGESAVPTRDFCSQ